MAGDTGFPVLHEELGLSPGISDLDAFKQTYRRRVAQLHPDRKVFGHADTDRLQPLPRLYGAALAFECRYSRPPRQPARGCRADGGNACADTYKRWP
jgi:hypothetical protein